MFDIFQNYFNLVRNIFIPLNFWGSLKFLFLYFKSKKNKNIEYETFRFKNHFIMLSSNLGDIWSFLEIFNFFEYKTIFNLIPKIEMKQFCLIDLGANIGLAYAYFNELKLIKKYIGVEPYEKNFKLLHFNTFSRSSSILNKAVWVDSKGVNFSDNKDNNSNFITTDGVLKVETITLSEILDKVDDDIFLKMDIEGAEYRVLKNNIKFLSNRVKYIAFEFHEIKNNNYLDYLNEISLYFTVVEVKKDNQNYSLVFGLNKNLK